MGRCGPLQESWREADVRPPSSDGRQSEVQRSMVYHPTKPRHHQQRDGPKLLHHLRLRAELHLNGVGPGLTGEICRCF